MRRFLPFLVCVLAFGCQSREVTPPSPGSTASSAQAGASPTTALTGTEAPIASTELAVAPEVNPPGDIPDSQAFVRFRSTVGGYDVEVPEGWARTENGAGVTFADKLDGVNVSVSSAVNAPNAGSAQANEAKALQQRGRAVQITDVKDVKLPSGPAVVIRYTSNSDPNPVTNKQVRLENETYLYFRNGKEAALTLWAPKGADNADQWNRMSKSFHWR